MKTKIIALDKVKTKETVFFLTLLFVASFVPIIGNQVVVGPIVNATLFLATMFIGIQGAVLVAFLPSIIALFSGIIPFATFPIIPFIVTGNVILILVFNHFRQQLWKGVLLASFAKFAFLYTVSFFIFNRIFEGSLASQIVATMSWPQFATALLGGVVALGAKSFLKI